LFATHSLAFASRGCLVGRGLRVRLRCFSLCIFVGDSTGFMVRVGKCVVAWASSLWAGGACGESVSESADRFCINRGTCAVRRRTHGESVKARSLVARSVTHRSVCIHERLDPTTPTRLLRASASQRVSCRTLTARSNQVRDVTTCGLIWGAVARRILTRNCATWPTNLDENRRREPRQDTSDPSRASQAFSPCRPKACTQSRDTTCTADKWRLVVPSTRTTSSLSQTRPWKPKQPSQ
jgi:hypothetical protein